MNGPRDLAVTVEGFRTPPRTHRPALSLPRLAMDPPEALADHFGSLATEEGTFTLDGWGVVVSVTHRDNVGRPSPLPNRAAFERGWRAQPVGDMLWFDPHGAAFCFVFAAPVEVALLHDAHAAACGLTETWLDLRGLRPVEYLPGRIRPGWTVEATDPLAPVALPRGTVDGVRRATPILWSGRASLTPEELVAAAALLPMLAPVQFPDARPKRGAFGSLLHYVTRRA